MSTAVDFHSHILPGIDDGSKTLQESVAMPQMEAAQGIEQVVATPHFYPNHDRLERFLERRYRAETALREEMKCVSGLPRLHIGTEVHFFSGICDCEELSQLSVNGGRYVLIEMPHAPWSEGTYQQLEGIYTKQNLIPIIAHIDRYIGRFRSHGIPDRLAHMPVLVQANAEFFLRKGTASMALSMLREGRIHLIGSDCHNLKSRKPNLAEAVERIMKKAGEDALAHIHRYEQAVLGA